MKRRRRILIFLSLRSVANCLGMHTYRLVRFVKNCKIEIYACLSCRRSKLVAALIGREYDLWSIGASAKQRCNLFRLSMRRQPEVIDFPNKFIAFKVANCLIAANTKPIWLNAVGKKLTGPIGEALADQCEARHGNENGLRFKCLGDPICGKALAGSARHNQATTRRAIADEMSLCSGDGCSLMRSWASSLWSCASALQLSND